MIYSKEIIVIEDNCESLGAGLKIKKQVLLEY